MSDESLQTHLQCGGCGGGVCVCVCVGGAHITIDYCHVECKCLSVCVQHEDLSFCFESVFDPLL